MAAKYHCIVPVYHSGTKKGSALGAVNMLISIGGVAINETFRHLAVDYLFWYSIFIVATVEKEQRIW